MTIGTNTKTTVTLPKLANFVLQAYSFNREYDDNGVHFDYLMFVKTLQVIDAKITTKDRETGAGYFITIELNGFLLFAVIGWLEGNQYGIKLYDHNCKQIGKRI